MAPAFCAGVGARGKSISCDGGRPVAAWTAGSGGRLWSDDQLVAGERVGRLVVRLAGPADARLIVQVVAEAFRGYRDWAPSRWSPPQRSEGPQVGAELARPDVVPAGARGRAPGWSRTRN